MQTINTQTVAEKISKPQPWDFFLIDAREPEEFDYDHIPGAINFPWHTLVDKTTGIKKDTALITYCNTGNRAGRAAKLLEDAGFTNVSLYKQGMEAWREHH